MKLLPALCGMLMALGACADGTDVPADSRDASFLLVGKGDGPGIDEDSDEACSVLAASTEVRP